MMKFEAFINEICCDDRIKDGIFRIENQEHVTILQEYLEKAGYSIDEIVAKTARLFEAGRFPERQAYNKDGILVTFPSKEYRDRAVDKGTHFAENPKKNVGTLYAPGDTGDLSTSDVSTAVQGDGQKDDKADKSDTVSLDQELNKKITGDDKVDHRSTKEKVQDAQAVSAILVSDVPLVNYSIDEAVRCGFYNKGFSWYDSNGELIGEQVYDEATRQVTIQAEREAKKKSTKTVEKPATKSCDAQQMEYNINKEFNKVNSNDAVAKEITAKLKKIGITGSKALGNLRCDITNPLFKNIDTTSKTDLIFAGNYQGKARLKTSLKATGAQICSAQNAEVNSVVSSVLAELNESQKVMSDVSSFIMKGLEKSFYVPLQDTVKEQLNKSLTSAIKGKASVEEIKQEAEQVKKLVQQNLDYVQNGEIPVDVTEVMLMLNQIFVQQPRRGMIIEELATGKRRFAKSGGDVDCIADHMMTWNCDGDFHMYTVQEFLVQNDKNISFRFSNRGGTRGISIRGDIKAKTKKSMQEMQLDEGAMDYIKTLGTNITKYFSDVWNKIKSLTGELKNYFVQLWESIKSGLQTIYETILKFGQMLQGWMAQGWQTFTSVLGFEGHGDGEWIWQMPASSTPVSEPDATSPV